MKYYGKAWEAEKTCLLICIEKNIFYRFYLRFINK